MTVLKSEFFGGDSIVIDKLVIYKERRTGGIYVYEPSKLERVISGFKTRHDRASLERLVRELFWICNQGRRPWSLEAEHSFLGLVSVGYELLTYLRAVGKVPHETYAFIDPLDITLRLEREVEHLQKVRSHADSERWIGTSIVFDQLTHFYIAIFVHWVSDYPRVVTLPTIDNMKYLLETGNDREFAVLLTTFARTKDLNVKQLLIDFSRDDEPPVRVLAERLLAEFP